MTGQWLRTRWPRTPWWWLVMLLPGIALIVGVPLLAAPADAAPAMRAIAALPGVVALVLPVWITVEVGRRDRRDERSARRRRLLGPVREGDASGALSEPRPAERRTSALAWLKADASRAHFVGRASDMRALDDWLASGTPVVIVDGAALTGKRRLAIEFTERRLAGWFAGWMQPGTGDEVVDCVAACGDDAVVLVDGYSLDLVRLLGRLEAHGDATPRIRVLVTARDAEGLRARMSRASAPLADKARVVHLAALREPDRKYELFRRDYAARCGVPDRGLPSPPTWDAPPIGLVHAAALAAVLSRRRRLDFDVPPAPRAPAAPHGRLDLDAVLKELWAFEVASWADSRRDEQWALGGLSDAELERGLLTLTLLGAGDESAAEAALRAVPDLAQKDPGVLRNLYRWARFHYPAVNGGVDVRPEIVADAAFLRDRELVRALAARADDALVERMVRATPLLPASADVVAAAIGGSAERFVYAVQVALDDAPTNGRLDAALAGVVEGCALESETAKRVLGLIPKHALLRTRVAVGARFVALVRSGPDAARPDLARALQNQAVWLGAVGRREEGVAASEEAVGLWRRLAAQQPEALRSDLARALNNHAIRLGEVGRREEALAASEEAVGLWRRLAAEQPEALRPDLARALNNDAIRLGEVGRREEALAASEEAVGLWRGLAAGEPEALRPDLARALTNDAIQLGEVGRREEALAASEEAVGLWRGLAAEEPEALRPDLARALDNEAVRLGAVGRREEALAASEEAVALWRGLAAEQPEALRPDLARALTNHAIQLGEAARREEALAASEEAVGFWRGLAGEPEAFRPDLARALDNQANRLRAVGRREEALAASEEAVGLWRGLAAGEPDAFRPNLARALTNHALPLGEAGRLGEGLAVGQEAVVLWRELAAGRPAAFLPSLANALRNVAIDLGNLGRLDETLTAIDEAVERYEALDQAHPDLFKPNLAEARRAQASLRSLAGG